MNVNSVLSIQKNDLPTGKQLLNNIFKLLIRRIGHHF